MPGGKRRQIIRVSRQSSSGTYDFFREHVLGKKDFKLGSRDMNGSKEVVELVATTPGAIGYSGMGYATPGGEDAQGLAGRRASRPSSPRRRRPSTRAIRSPARCMSTRSASPRARSKKYIDWILSRRRPEDRGGQRLRAAAGSAQALDGARRRDIAAPRHAADGLRDLSDEPLTIPPRASASPDAVAVREATAAWAGSASAPSSGLIRLCGISAIIFVLGDLLLRLPRGGAGPLREQASSSREFLSAPSGIRPRQSNVRYGALALIAGTLQRHGAGDGHRRAVRPRRGDLRLGVLRPQAAGDAEDRHRAAGGHPVRSSGASSASPS